MEILLCLAAYVAVIMILFYILARISRRNELNDPLNNKPNPEE